MAGKQDKPEMIVSKLWQVDVLAPVLNWFTEGHDLTDYINAKALMERIELQR